MGQHSGIIMYYGIIIYTPNIFCQDLGENITDGISANIVGYTISVVPVESAAPEISINATKMGCDCNTTCKYILKNLTEMLKVSYYIYVTAKNVLFDGHSEEETCFIVPISKNCGLE